MNPTRHAQRFAVLALALLLAGCGADPASDANAPLPALPTRVVAADATSGARAWDGVVEAVQQATVSAQTTGRVTEVNVDVGDRVERDAVLLRLTAVEQEAAANTARAQLRAAEATAAEASQNHDRVASLLSGKFVSQAHVDQARAARDTAVAAIAVARAQLAQAMQQIGYTVVRAPYTGIVSRRDAEPGEAVAPGQVLLTLHSRAALRIEVQLPQSVAARVGEAASAMVEFENGRRVQAAGVTLFPTADPDTHSVAVRVALPELGDDAPVPGSTARILFALGLADDPASMSVSIPHDALVQRGELTGVYVLADNRLHLRQLRLGRSDGATVEVLSGLRPGETIVTDPIAATQALVQQREAGMSRD